ncbi:MAG: hypothetical protein LBK50_02705 [Candidatus Nomurabacteria bacterium]|jgi:hypothetical protein|nr:hypothetical protein [Candidatus Nomurabacteria bacterium]
MKKLNIVAVSAFAVTLGLAVAATPIFAGTFGVADYSGTILTLNISSENSNVVSQDIYNALAGDSFSNVTEVNVITANPAWVAGGFVNNMANYGFDNPSLIVNLQVSGDLTSADAVAVAAAIKATPTNAPVSATVAGTADLSSITNLSGLANFTLTAADIIAPDGVNLEDWASALGLMDGQIVTQNGKTYEVQADGSVVEVASIVKAANTGVK